MHVAVSRAMPRPQSPNTDSRCLAGVVDGMRSVAQGILPRIHMAHGLKRTSGAVKPPLFNSFKTAYRLHKSSQVAVIAIEAVVPHKGVSVQELPAMDKLTPSQQVLQAGLSSVSRLQALLHKSLP